MFFNSEQKMYKLKSISFLKALKIVTAIKKKLNWLLLKTYTIYFHSVEDELKCNMTARKEFLELYDNVTKSG